MLENIIKQLSAKNKKTDNIVVDKLIQFINDNFSKNISLQDAAESVFLILHIAADFLKNKQVKISVTTCLKSVWNTQLNY